MLLRAAAVREKAGVLRMTRGVVTGCSFPYCTGDVHPPPPYNRGRR